MVDDPNLLWFGFFLWLGITLLVLSLFGSKSKEKALKSGSLTDTLLAKQAADAIEIEQLRQQCQRLRLQLEEQSTQLSGDFQDKTFEQLRPLLINYPTARQMAEAKPDLSAKNLVALLTPLENLTESWGYEPIGKPWEQVSYDPQLHQPDADDITEGELVYIRFVGYRDGERILYPAKVSRILPGGIKFKDEG